MPYALRAQLRTIRRVGAPLLAIQSADLRATVAALAETLPDIQPDQVIPMAEWDVVRGTQPLGSHGQSVCAKVPPKATNPVEMLKAAQDLPDDAVLLVHNLHQFFTQPGVVQALSNLRDPLKQVHALVILLAPTLTLPDVLRHDVIVLEEPLPDATVLGSVLDRMVQDYRTSLGDTALCPVTPEQHAHAVDAVLGLPAGAAEQEIAMSLSDDGVALPQLYQRKRQVIAQTPGLSVYSGTETFADIGGVTQLKQFLRHVLVGRWRPRAICFLD